MLIQFRDKMDLAEKIVQFAPQSAKGVRLGQRVPPHARVVMYSTSLVGGYLSLRKLAEDLGLQEKRQRKEREALEGVYVAPTWVFK